MDIDMMTTEQRDEAMRKGYHGYASDVGNMATLEGIAQ